MAEHSPLPWRVEFDRSTGTLSLVDVVDVNHDGVCEFSNSEGLDSANAALIVRCVNSHAALVEALNDAVDALKCFHGLGMSPAVAAEAWALYRQHSPEMKRIRAALALAEGREG